MKAQLVKEMGVGSRLFTQPLLFLFREDRVSAQFFKPVYPDCSKTSWVLCQESRDIVPGKSLECHRCKTCQVRGYIRKLMTNSRARQAIDSENHGKVSELIDQVNQ